ncbi:Pyroglutamylated RF-amide peptide receptor [Halotydeus destructor]|nr:Pyroglutamylated RF-amide peptide receptor [Halotydeus destructor]
MKTGNPRSNITTSPLFEFLFTSADLMINTTNVRSDGYFLNEISRNNFSLPSAEAFAWFFEFCTHLSDIAEQLNKTGSDHLPSESPLDPNDHRSGTEWSTEVSPTLSPGVKAIFVLLVLVTSLASVVGNAISLWVTMNIRSTWTTSSFLICLAVTDLLQTFSICTSETANILYDWQWIYGGFLCKTIPFIQTASALANALTLSCIAIGRYLAITATLKWQTLELRKIATVALVVIWSFSIVICLPISFLFEYVETTRGETAIDSQDSDLVHSEAGHEEEGLHASVSRLVVQQPSDQYDSISRTFCWWSSTNEAAKRIYFYVVPACMFLPLFLIITIMYMYMARYLWYRKPLGESEMQASASRTQQTKRRRIVKLLALLILVFLCCRGPVQVFNMLQGMKKYNTISSSVLIFKNCLIALKLINCALNPLLYCLLHDRFKAYLMTYLRRLGSGLLSFRPVTIYTRTGHDPDDENSSQVLQDFGPANASGHKQLSCSSNGKKSSSQLKQLAMDKLGPLLSPSRVRQRGELSWAPGQNSTLERLIHNEHHSV